MATGALDANGIWQYGEDDSEATFSGLLNKLASSTSSTVTRLEGFTGYTGTLPIANGGTGATTVAAAQDTLRVGLVPISPTSVANSGGTVTVDTLGRVNWTGGASISLNGVFTSAYDNYRIVIRWTGFNGDGTLRFRLRAAGTDSAASNYYFAGYAARHNNTTYTKYSTGATTYAEIGGGQSSYGAWASTSMDVFGPQIAQKTTAVIQHIGANTNAYTSETASMVFDVGTQFDGITFYPSFTSVAGVFQVFGYNQ